MSAINNIMITLKVFNADGWEVDDDTHLQTYFNGGWVNLTSTQGGYLREGNTFTKVTNMLATDEATQGISLRLKAESGYNYIVVPEIVYSKPKTSGDEVVKRRFNEGIFRREYVRNGNGNGKDVSITFKSLCGGPTEGMENVCVLFAGFNDNLSLIDLYPRTKLELSEVRTADPTTLHTYPAIVTDGDTRYIPVATGMNARNCTTQLRLVSTNI